LLVEIHEVFGSLNGPLTVMAMRVLSQAKKEKETLTVGQLGIGGELLRSLLISPHSKPSVHEMGKTGCGGFVAMRLLV